MNKELKLRSQRIIVASLTLNVTKAVKINK
jgi:hypothetical protein